jgi:hypothetical protein
MNLRRASPAVSIFSVSYFVIMIRLFFKARDLASIFKKIRSKPKRAKNSILKTGKNTPYFAYSGP